MFVAINKSVTVDSNDISIIHKAGISHFGESTKSYEGRVTLKDKSEYCARLSSMEDLELWYDRIMKAVNPVKLTKGSITRKKNLETSIKRLEAEEKQAKLAIKGFENSIKNLMEKERILRKTVSELQGANE